MRAPIFSLALGLVLPGMLACDNDDPPANPDAPPDTTPPDPPFKEYDADEGGEVRLEYVRFAAGNAATRITAFAYKDAGPTKFFPYLELDGCTDMRMKDKWPMATNAIEQRQYYDLGKVLISGGPETLTLEKRMRGRDPFAREHPDNAWYFHFPGSMGTDGGTYISANAKLDVTFTGSDEFPGQIYDDVLFMPQDFNVLDPGVGPYDLTGGQDHTFTWQVTTTNPPTGYDVLSLVAFTGDPVKGPVVVCVEKDDGSITVPSAMVDIVRAEYPQGGTLARQTLTHVTRELVTREGKTGRRLDFVSVWCYATRFNVP